MVCHKASKQEQIKEDLMNLPVTNLQERMLNQAVVSDNVDDQMLSERVWGRVDVVKSCCLCWRSLSFACLVL